MTAALTQFITVGRGVAERRIAMLIELRAPENGPGLMWLPGFMSEMTSTKVSYLAAYAAERGLAMTRLDYSGHGQSGGDFSQCTIGRWLEEVEAVFALTRGAQIVVGSSMGGHLALLLLKSLMRTKPGEAQRIKALVLIAPAWDVTELMWRKIPESARRTLMDTGVYQRPSAYGDGPYMITRHLIEEGRNHLIGGEPYDPGRPVHILHGLQDPDVPWEHTLDLDAHLSGNWVRVTAVPDGDHRLSRPEDLALLQRVIEGLLG